MIDKMRMGEDTVRRPARAVWTPPVDYEFTASHLPESQREAYIERCRIWLAENPPTVGSSQVQQTNVDLEVIAALYAKDPQKTPSIEERVAAYRAAGYSEEKIEAAQARAAMLEATVKERQKVLDDIFAKWPAANKTDPKKAKVIKAVKKRV